MTMGALTILQTCATLTAVSLNVCPIFDEIPAIKRSRTTGDRSPLIFVAIWTNACLWVAYGIFINAFNPISITNLTGVLSGSYFLYTFHTYSPPVAKTRFLQAFTIALTFVLTTYTYVFLFPSPSPSTTKFRLGALCCGVTVCVYASPLGTVLKAIKIKNNKPISLFFALVGTANSTLWTGYGLLTEDPWVWAPSVIGVFLSLMQVCVFGMYSSRFGGGGKSPHGHAHVHTHTQKRPSLSEFLLQEPTTGAGEVRGEKGDGGEQQVTLL